MTDTVVIDEVDDLIVTLLKLVGEAHLKNAELQASLANAEARLRSAEARLRIVDLLEQESARRWNLDQALPRQLHSVKA